MCSNASQLPKHVEVSEFANSSVNLRDNFRWTCNLCQEVIRAKLAKSLQCARRRHIEKAHPRKAKLANPIAKKRILIATASAEIPEPQRSWSCPKCNKGFGWLSNRSLTASRLAREKTCYHLTAKQLRQRCYERASWKAKHDKLNQENAALKRSQTDDAIAEYNKQGLGSVVRVPA